MKGLAKARSEYVIKVIITYNSEINQEFIINAYSDEVDYSQETENLISKIDENKTYKIEVQTDSVSCINITITSND